MSTFKIEAEIREESGKGSSRRLRRLAGLIPAVVYGADKDAQSLTLVHKDFFKLLQDETFFSSVLTLSIGGKEEKVVLKDLQRHPAKNIVMHADFLRVDPNAEISVRVPLHFINEDVAKGVKIQGGRITHTATVVEVTCLPANLPEFIEVDMATIQAGQTFHLSNITFPEGVVSTELMLGEEHDSGIATCIASKGKEEDAAE